MAKVTGEDSSVRENLQKRERWSYARILAKMIEINDGIFF